ncbi:MAG TPA: GNAT family protein [Bacillota bacterium]|jgi:RimJ/RimL family protein N-acetyltransferase
MLHGHQTYLRPLAKSDLPTVLRGVNDEQVMFHLGPHFPFTEVEAEAWHEQSGRADRTKVMTICRKDDGVIGFLTLDRIHHRNRNGEVTIALFDQANWGRGYGTDALRTLLRFVFEEMNFHRIQLLVHEDNSRAIKAYEKLGFVREGLLRDENFRGGRYTDTLVMGVLAGEFAKAAGTLSPP